MRIETEDLVSELQARRPELVARSDRDSFLEALQHAVVARQLLNFHASMARASGYAERLGIRDALQADNLSYVVSRERDRGRVLAFAHNSHMKRGKAEWQLGTELVFRSPLKALLTCIGWPFSIRLVITVGGRLYKNGIRVPSRKTPFEIRLSA